MTRRTYLLMVDSTDLRFSVKALNRIVHVADYLATMPGSLDSAFEYEKLVKAATPLSDEPLLLVRELIRCALLSSVPAHPARRPFTKEHYELPDTPPAFEVV